MNIFKKFSIVIISVGVYLAILIPPVLFVSCSKDNQLEIQNNFPFEVEVMPVRKEIAYLQAVEIRVKIKRSGYYDDTQYFIRYFQYEGEGQLKYYDDPSYQPNDTYDLPKPNEQFRLYYTSISKVSQSFSIWISDSFGNEREVKFEFKNKD